MAKKESKLPFKVTQVNETFLLQFNEKTYELNNGQYNSVLRKQDIPADRLEIWLESYIKPKN